MRRHRVAKLTPEQIRVLVAVVNATRWEPSDYINWPNVAEKTGVSGTWNLLMAECFHRLVFKNWIFCLV